MPVRKWIMKQYWRLLQVRGIWNVFFGVLLLAVAYYGYIPLFVDMGILGPFTFAGLLFIVFIIAGYLYDRVLVLWGPQQEVLMERNPFQYVPHPRDQIFWFPVYSSILSASDTIAKQFDLDSSAIEDTRKYFARLQEFSALRKEDIDAAIEHRQQFVESHPFRRILVDKEMTDDVKQPKDA